MKKHENRGLEAPKIHQKSTKMVPRSAPKGILEEGWETCERQWFNVEAFWRHLGDFGRSKLPAANSRSGSMKKGVAIGEF